jgi:hypothetical protein
MRSIALAVVLFCAPVLLASGSAEAKKCKTGKPCGDACIAKDEVCKIEKKNTKGQFCSSDDQCKSGKCEKKHCK